MVGARDKENEYYLAFEEGGIGVRTLATSQEQ